MQILNKEFKIIDKDTISNATTYLENQKVKNLINEIKSIDINNLSVSEAFAFIEKLQNSLKNFE